MLVGLLSRNSYSAVDVYTCGAYGTLIWLEQIDPGDFTPHRAEASAHGHLAMEVGNFDHDGNPDVVVGHHGQARNADSEWLTVFWNPGVESTE